MSLSKSPLAQSPSHSLADPAQHIKVSSFYEIDHSKLPPKSPDQLNSVRVVLVNEKTRMRVSLRFPSIYSLRAYFDECNHTKPEVKKLPALDEKFIMGSEIAAEALYRRIPPHEIAEKRNLWRFWAVPSIAAQNVSGPPSNSKPTSIAVSKMGSLWSELKGTGMVEWGLRRQIQFLARHVEDKRKLNVSSNIKGEEENTIKVLSEGEEGKDGEEGDDEEEENAKADKSLNAKRNRKRMRHGSSKRTQEKKRLKREKKNHVVVNYKQKKNKVLKNSIDRWSAER